MAYLIQHLLTKSARIAPKSIALICGNEQITYAELDAESTRLGTGLAALGTERGDRVGLYLPRGIAAVAGLFGVLKAGAAYVPLDPFCPPARLAYILNACEITTLLTTRENIGVIERTMPELPLLRNIVIMNGGEGLPEAAGQARVIGWKDLKATDGPIPETGAIDADLAYVLFTSGSTGTPKGVMLSHRNALTFIESAADLFRISPHDRVSNICPLHFDMSVFDLFVAVRAGAAVVIIPESAATFPVRLAETIARHRISVWNSVPSALVLLAAYANLNSHDLSTLRMVLFAGERFPIKYLRRLQEALPTARFCNLYGQTEANSSTCYWIDRIPEDPAASLPIGKALPNFEVFALDDDGRKIVGPGREGELYVRASTVALGYWGDAERTAKAFIPNPLAPEGSERVYRTGDLVSMDDEGNYLFLGRKDHLIKSRGYRIEIGEIESVLSDHALVKSAVVLPIPDELIGNRIMAIIVPSSPGCLTREAVLQHCSRKLPRYMLPELIEFRDGLPTTSSGKVDRTSLRSTLASTTGRQTVA
ncbi:MAG: amino acid adenylation domain-containing protein [Nitrospiraceae bacterium]|nr:amino acid adenylation domain-containing protein [Nitrospiraceae bacterium]